MEKFIGVIIMVASTALYASLPVLIKKPSSQLPPFTVMAITMFVLFIGLIIVAIGLFVGLR